MTTKMNSQDVKKIVFEKDVDPRVPASKNSLKHVEPTLTRLAESLDHLLDHVYISTAEPIDALHVSGRRDLDDDGYIHENFAIKPAPGHRIVGVDSTYFTEVKVLPQFISLTSSEEPHRHYTLFYEHE